MTTPDPQRSYAATDMDEEIDACQNKILELIDSVEQDGGEAISSGSDIAQKIAHFYAKMGDLFLHRGDKAKAAACYESALQLHPGQISARMNLLKTKNFVTEDDHTRAFLMGMLAAQPSNAGLLNQLGKVHHKLHEHSLARACFEQALALEPDNADSLYWLAGLQQDSGEREAAEKNYLRAAKLRPLINVPAVQATSEFSVLLIFAPFAGNTPTEYLMAKPPYEINIFPLFPHMEYDLALLKCSGQIVINFVSDADQGQGLLPQVVTLVDKLDMPVINHPSKIQKTTREGIAQLLHGIADCRLAQVVRHVAGEKLPVKLPFSAPFLARPAGTHGGEKFEMMENLAALEPFIRQEPDADHYIMEYVDYRSADGHFRKYRFIFVDGQIMPYHLAIGDHWKVHHITTDMSKNDWMQAEEKAFLENPQAVFTPQHYQAMHAIRQAVGLDYFGIDCGIDRAENLVVFEVNASMLVHQKNEAFPYKAPFVEKIKQAFDAMLKKRARA